MSERKHYNDCGENDGDLVVPWPDLPPEVQHRIGPALPPGHAVWSCPRRSGRAGVQIEWWWHDETGELIEAFGLQ